MKYRIIKRTFIDETGKPSQSTYKIQVYKRFLFFWMKWKDITHITCGYGDCYTTTTYWKSYEEAEEFAKEFICKGKVYDDTILEVVATNECE